MKTVFRWLIQFYRLFISPMLGPRCRFYPTCSQYALEALEQHSFARASWLISRRLARCQPWGGSGYDPVPPANPDSGKDHPDQHAAQSLRGLNLARHGCDCRQHSYTTRKARHRNRNFTPYTSQPRKAHSHGFVRMNVTGSTFS